MQVTDTSTFTKSLTSSQPENSEQVLDRLDIKDGDELRLFVCCVQQTTTRKQKTQVKDWRQSSKYDSKFRKGFETQCTQEFFQFLHFSPENTQNTQKMMNKMRLTVVHFIKKSWSQSINEEIEFPVHMHNYFQTIHSTLSEDFAAATESG